MKPIALMALPALLVWGAIAVFGDARLRLEATLGMLGPVAVAAADWLLMERTFAREPQKLTSRMTMAFGVKLVFFGLYVAAVLVWSSVRSVPFVGSFTGSFVVLFLMEAFFLRRLLQASAPGPSPNR